MRLNDIKSAPGARQPRKRLGRGMGSGLGKTAGRGHKGQHARAGGFHKLGFEGGQMPLQRRLPKFGFTSTTAGETEEVRLHELAGVKADVIDADALRSAGLIRRSTRYVRVMLSGAITRPVVLKGISVTRGARAAIEAAGGRIED